MLLAHKKLRIQRFEAPRDIIYGIKRAKEGRRKEKEKAWRLPTFPRLRDAVSSAREGLTSVFGKGTGVPPPP